jgi:non-homologous end joining protein Ku
VELLKKKQTGIQPKRVSTEPTERRVVNLMEALRRSIESEHPKKPAVQSTTARRRTAGRKRA